jgi:hypothetical protein
MEIAMNTSLDELMLALQAAVTTAQQALLTKNKKTEATLALKDNLIFSNMKRAGNNRSISLPEAGLRCMQQLQLSMFSLTCKCRLKRAMPFFMSRSFCLQMLNESEATKRRDILKMEIVFQGRTNPVGKILINGVPLTPTSAKKDALPTGKKSIQLFKHLLDRFSVQGFSLTENQLECIRQIIQQEKPVAC